MLYNEEQKKLYFKTVNLKEPTQKYFEKTAETEFRLNKDLSLWNISEIIGFYKSLCTASAYYLNTLTSQYRLYVNWCIAENFISGMNHFNEVDQNTCNQCVSSALLSSKIVSRKELDGYIKGLSNPVDQFVSLALFEGIGGRDLNELIKLRISDFNTETYEVVIGEKHIKFDDDLYSYALSSEAEYSYKLSSESTAKIDSLPMVGEPGQIIKKIKTQNKQDDEVTPRNIVTKMQRLKELTGRATFAYKALHESGRIDYVNRLVAEGKYATAYDALSDDYVVSVYGKLNSCIAYVNKYKDFLH